MAHPVESNIAAQRKQRDSFIKCRAGIWL